MLMCIFSTICTACVPCIFTLLMTLVRLAVRIDTGADKKQTEDKAFGTKGKETSGKFS